MAFTQPRQPTGKKSLTRSHNQQRLSILVNSAYMFTYFEINWMIGVEIFTASLFQIMQNFQQRKFGIFAFIAYYHRFCKIHYCLKC